jgi:hypothetical protein
MVFVIGYLVHSINNPVLYSYLFCLWVLATNRKLSWGLIRNPYAFLGNIYSNRFGRYCRICLVGQNEDQNPRSFMHGLVLLRVFSLNSQLKKDPRIKSKP